MNLRPLFSFLRRSQLERDMEEELAFHIDERARLNEAAGMSKDEALTAARRQFGWQARLREEAREARGHLWLHEFFQDLVYGARLLLRSPGFTAVAVLTLALGIGINTGVFSLFKGVMLRPLPGVPASRDLVALTWKTQGGDLLTLSHLELKDFQGRMKSLSGLEASGSIPFSFDSDGTAQRVWGEFVSGGHHNLLGVRPHLGRMITPEDDHFPGGALVVVLSHGFWQRKFGGDPAVIGRSVVINRQACTIVGVAEQGFAGTTVGFALDLYVPTAAAQYLRPFGGNASDLFTRRGFRSLAAVGRLKAGYSFEQARAEMETLGAAMAQTFPTEYKGKTAVLLPFLKSPFGAQTYMAPIFGMMMGMTALVLLIMCANIANLLLARATAREHEIAIRLAVGAGRFRLVRQLMTECLLLSMLGGMIGCALAVFTPHLLKSVWSTSRFPITINAEPDYTVLLFATAASFLCAFVFGLVPALKASKPDMLQSLKTGRTISGQAHNGWRNVLVVAQIAFSVPLLVCAGLLLRSSQRQQQAHFGFQGTQVALLSFELRPNGYDDQRGRNFCETLAREVETLPGVDSVALAARLPLAIVPYDQNIIEIPGRTPPPHEQAMILMNVVTPGYFNTMRIALISGRDFAPSDKSGTNLVAIINDAMAQRYWPEQNPIGRSFRAKGQVREVIGVVRDIKYLTPSETPAPYFYLPHAQHFASEMVLHVRTRGQSAAILKPSQDCIRKLDPQLPVFSSETMEDYLAFALSLSSFAARGLLLAGLLGLLLTAIGVFGTISYSVSVRTREIGVRLALGASRSQIVRMVLRQAIRLAGIGLLVGLGLAAVATPILKSLLFETAALDPLTFLVVVGVLILATLPACCLPAWHASRVPPVIALQAE